MNKSVDYFNKNGYVVLHNALTKEECDYLTKHMFNLFDQGKLIKDEQCPLSDSVYGDPLFDEILQKFATPIGAAVGKKLLPTYTYARIYRPGEVLKKHTDRPACEISATLTLGYDSKPIWPIFFDDEKEINVTLDVGELAVYRGCDVVHWRPSFKGKWHVQVFFHYVDADGPHKDQVMDGRSNFGIQKTNEVVPNRMTDNKQIQSNKTTVNLVKPVFNSILIPKYEKDFPGYYCIDRNNLTELMFTPQECQKIIDLTKVFYPIAASVGGTVENSLIARQIRSANIFVLENDEENKWIFEKVANIISVVNEIHFDYDISGIAHGIQLIHYSADSEIKGHYDWHIDAGKGDPVYRKISFTAQLSDEKDYEGCELVINNHGGQIVGTKERGSVHLFPSYMPHKVSPIIKGDRYALVIWIHGPKRFR